MKKAMFFAVLFAAGLLTTACSSDNDIVQEKNSLENKFDANGNAFVNIAINTPTRSGTRANEVYDDGTAAEYAVNDAVLVLFNGTSANEGTATFVGAYNLENPVSGGSGENDRVTERLLFTKQINKGDANLSTSGLLAFVALNVNGMFEADGATHALTINGSGFTGNFNALKEIVLTKIGTTGTGLFMSNAPMSSVAGGSVAPTSATIKYLTKIEAEDIYNSESDAFNGSRFIDIYVERAAVKVDFSTTLSGSTELTTSTVTYNADGIKWIVENYNTSYYAERHIGTGYLGYVSDNVSSSLPTRYRFVDGTATATGLYRTYWAEDINMADVPNNVTTAAGTQPATTSWKSVNGVDYIAENTVNAQSLKQEYTTRVVIAVPFNGGSDFYTSSLTGADVIYSPDDMKTKVLNFIKTLPSYATWSAANSTATLDITFANAANGSATVGTVTASNGSDTDGIKTEVNSKIQFSFYKDGLAYYKVLIKHFGDTETPLGSSISGKNYNDIYGADNTDQARNFLGRYSVVRNNWYNIQLDGIKHIGKPSVPEIPTDTPDDEIDAYLKVRINVLSWAKRTQSVQL